MLIAEVYMIKRYNEVIEIISDPTQSNEALYELQMKVNHIIHYNLYNFMFPHKVAEMIDKLTTLFVEMNNLKSIKYSDRRDRLLEQGRTIILKLKPYAKMEYTVDEYREAYSKIFSRQLAQYLNVKNNLNMEIASSMLSQSKQTIEEYKRITGATHINKGNEASAKELPCSKGYLRMITELKEFIMNSL